MYHNLILDLKSKLFHETILPLTHISTTLTMHRGNWQLDWAQGLGSFASGKEFGSPACPAFHAHIFSEKTGVSLIHRNIRNISLKGL